MVREVPALPASTGKGQGSRLYEARWEALPPLKGVVTKAQLASGGLNVTTHQTLTKYFQMPQRAGGVDYEAASEAAVVLGVGNELAPTTTTHMLALKTGELIPAMLEGVAAAGITERVVRLMRQ